MSGYVPPSRPVGLRLLVEPRIPQPEGVRDCQFYKFMATRYAVAFGTALEPTSRENQKKEVENIDDNIIFLKKSFLNHFKNLKDPRIDRSKDHLLIDLLAISILAVISGADVWTAIETYGKAKEPC